MKYKTLFFLTILFTFWLTSKSFAQFNKVGGGLILATGNDYVYEGISYYNKSVGINIRTNYHLNKKLEITPGLNIFLPNKESFADGGESSTTVYALNIDAHLILNPRTRNNFYFYVIGGVHASGWQIKDDHRSILLGRIYKYNKFLLVPGVNLGSGLQFKIGQKIDFFTEVKYTISKTHQLVFNPGILYQL